ncbi:hypothetical protein MMC20_002997 [Loxospora ochrophaea]|nr:hypothetical protein [Loxospora ochrophaea]
MSLTYDMEQQNYPIPEDTKYPNAFNEAHKNRFSLEAIRSDTNETSTSGGPVFLHGSLISPYVLANILFIPSLQVTILQEDFSLLYKYTIYNKRDQIGPAEVIALKMTPALLLNYAERTIRKSDQLALIAMRGEMNWVRGFTIHGLTEDQRDDLESFFPFPKQERRVQVQINTEDAGVQLMWAQVYAWVGPLGLLA